MPTAAGSHTKTCTAVLAGIGKSLHLDDVLSGAQAKKMVIVVNDRKFLDLVLLEDIGIFLK